MLEHSKNHNIEMAYLEIVESQNSTQREYAYHCTNVNPKIILEKGFHSSPVNGFTENNAFEALYQKHLPKNPCFVSKTPWDEDSKYILKIDITGLEKYPDFGHLIDTGAYYEETDSPDEILFYWEDKDLKYPSRHMSDELVSFLTSKPEDEIGIMSSDDYDGEMSFYLTGTCAIDGDEIASDRIEVVKGGNFSVKESSSEGDGINANKKDLAMITNVNKRREAELRSQIVPAEFSESMTFDKNLGAIVLTGSARSKIVQEANSTRYGTSDVSIEMYMSDEGNRLLFDITIYPIKGWDSEPVESVENYLSNFAPWIASHRIKKMVEQNISFLRYGIIDETVINKARHLIGRDYERNDFVQMELF